MIDIATLQAALQGYQAQYEQIISAMDDIRKRLGKTRGGGSMPTPFRKRRMLSAAARKRIAAAQRKRWAEYRAKRGRKSGGAKASAKARLRGSEAEADLDPGESSGCKGTEEGGSSDGVRPALSATFTERTTG